jgi:hypothetical protein
MNGQQVVKSFHYLLTDPCELRYPAVRPGCGGPNAIRSTETARVYYSSRQRGRMAAHGARAIVDDAGQALTYGYEYGPPAVVAPAPAVVAPTTVYGPNGGYYAPPTVVAPAPLVAPTTVYGPNGGYYSLALISALGRLTSRRSRFHCFDNSLTQVTGERFRHRRGPHRGINADRLAQPNRPDSNPAGHALSRDALGPTVGARSSLARADWLLASPVRTHRWADLSRPRKTPLLWRRRRTGSGQPFRSARTRQRGAVSLRPRLPAQSGAVVCAPACRSGCSNANASICMQASRMRRAVG